MRRGFSTPADLWVSVGDLSAGNCVNYRGFAIAFQSPGSEKPGFCDNLQLSTRNKGRNPVSEICDFFDKIVRKCDRL